MTSKPVEVLVVLSRALAEQLRELSMAQAARRDAEARERAMKEAIGEAAEDLGLDVDKPIILLSDGSSYRISKSVRTTTDYRAIVDELVNRDPSLSRLVLDLIERHTSAGTPTISFREQV